MKQFLKEKFNCLLAHSDVLQELKQEIIQNVEHRFVCSDRSILINALFAQEPLLCSQYADFNRNIIALDRYRQLRGHMLNYSMYYYFLSSQDKLDLISRHLDEQGNQALYYLLFLRVVTPLFFSEGLNLTYSHESHFHDIELLNSVVKSTWDIYGDRLEADLVNQYIIPQAAIKPGDYVIDGGAFTGDTALFMSKMVGETGKVFSFEPTKDSFNELVAHKFPNTVCIPKGLHECVGELYFSQEDLPAANRVTDDGSIKIELTSIDTFVKENHVEKIDFIKMDIEGSEVAALKGAKSTIEKFHPNMAICIYHNCGYDLIDVPYYLIANYGDVYHFTVRQNSIAWGESVIYAWRK